MISDFDEIVSEENNMATKKNTNKASTVNAAALPPPVVTAPVVSGSVSGPPVTAPAAPVLPTGLTPELLDFIQKSVAAGVTAALQTPPKEEKKKAGKAAQKAAGRERAKDFRQKRATEALAGAVTATGKSEAEVKAVFEAAHTYAAPANPNREAYKARYNAVCWARLQWVRYGDVPQTASDAAWAEYQSVPGAVKAA